MYYAIIDDNLPFYLKVIRKCGDPKMFLKCLSWNNFQPNNKQVHRPLQADRISKNRIFRPETPPRSFLSSRCISYKQRYFPSDPSLSSVSFQWFTLPLTLEYVEVNDLFFQFFSSWKVAKMFSEILYFFSRCSGQCPHCSHDSISIKCFTFCLCHCLTICANRVLSAI